MKNTCDICGDEFLVLLNVFVYDTLFEPGTIVQNKRICQGDYLKLEHNSVPERQ